VKALLVLVAVLLTQSTSASPFEGQWWTATRLGLSFAVQSERVTITVCCMMGRDGQTIPIAETLQTDGELHQRLAAGSTVVAKWLSPYRLEITYNGKDSIGAYRTSIETYTVSSDQKTLTARSSGPNLDSSDTETIYFR
jgi:hypothetical protein